VDGIIFLDERVADPRMARLLERCKTDSAQHLAKRIFVPVSSRVLYSIPGKSFVKKRTALEIDIL
jgi:hypothetical protein